MTALKSRGLDTTARNELLCGTDWTDVTPYVLSGSAIPVGHLFFRLSRMRVAERYVECHGVRKDFWRDEREMA